MIDSTRYSIGSYCSSRSWGGLEMNVLRFLKWMSLRGWDTVVYAHPDSQIYRSAVERGQKVRVIRSEFKYGDLPNAIRLARMIKRDNVRVLSLHQSPDMLLGVLAKQFSRSFFKLIYSQHMHVGGVKRDLFHRWEYNKFDAWISPVQWLADRVMEQTVVGPDRIHIVPRGIEQNRFTVNRPEKSQARARLDLPTDVNLIGVVGRLDLKKCQDTVVRALDILHKQGIKPHLAIIGDKTRGEETGYAEELHQLVDDLGLTDYVHFRPHQAEQEYAYAAQDIFVLPSESETYGMVMIEALTSGLPVIGTAAGGTLGQVFPNENGQLYPPHDDAALAECLKRYLIDEEFAARMAGKAAQLAAERYSHINQCDGWERVFETLWPEDPDLS